MRGQYEKFAKMPLISALAPESECALSMSDPAFPLPWLRDDRLAPVATSALPAWLWSADANRILWANPTGAAIFGAATAAAINTRKFDAGQPAAARIAQLAATLPPDGSTRLERLRGFGAGVGRALACACSRITLADDTPAVLVVAAERAGRRACAQRTRAPAAGGMRRAGRGFRARRQAHPGDTRCGGAPRRRHLARHARRRSAGRRCGADRSRGGSACAGTDRACSHRQRRCHGADRDLPAAAPRRAGRGRHRCSHRVRGNVRHGAHAGNRDTCSRFGGRRERERAAERCRAAAGGRSGECAGGAGERAGRRHGRHGAD